MSFAAEVKLVKSIAVADGTFTSWLRWWWNGFLTRRRFQEKGGCLFHPKREGLPEVGCRGHPSVVCHWDSEDSIEHYCRCPVVLRVAGHMMRLSYPPEMALNIWVLNSSWLDREDELRGISLLIYGCYLAFNSIRIKGISSSDQAFQCIAQHCRQGAMGHSACMSFLDRSWQRPVKHVC